MLTETAHSLVSVSRRPTLILIYTVTLTGILSNSLVTPAIPNILDDFGMPADAAGLLVAVGSLAGIVMAPIAGFLADRHGRRIVLTTCLVVFGVFGGLAALAPTFELLLAARFLQGVGSAALVNLAVVLIGDNWTGATRTKLIGRNSAVLTIGLAAIPLLSGVLTDAFGWRVSFAVYTVALLTAAAAWLTLSDTGPVVRHSVREQFGDALRVFKDPVLMASIISGFLVFVAIFGLFLTVLPVHLDEVFGLDAAQRGLVISLPAITASLASFNLGRIRLATSARSIVVFSALSLAVSYVTLGLTATLWVAVGAALLYGTSEGFFIPMLQDVNMEGAPDEHRGAVIAVWVGAARLGQTVGPVLAGLALGLVGTSATFMIGAVIPVAILLIGLFGPFSRTRKQAAPIEHRLSAD
ncbi:MAG TPA: MFS transporter [Acidimicrobiia bacterium]|nr:MFS transporter [Acidimicrobiia bacterium]